MNAKSVCEDNIKIHLEVKEWERGWIGFMWFRTDINGGLVRRNEPSFQ
jgi:hypothetical protein